MCPVARLIANKQMYCIKSQLFDCILLTVGQTLIRTPPNIEMELVGQLIKICNHFMRAKLVG
ncbi:protein of unknown function [Vibrio tapetis subsp. tapetis]|uniref:Uncharacterized protein n=1 Tax=Vibrio tapetis subsp. tapetis TaxID=1671868 RepID=A0A2N8ZDV8_9VIBR|nr:protein of unknown function [Vibrio tapetis subsp. tapetis]